MLTIAAGLLFTLLALLVLLGLQEAKSPTAARILKFLFPDRLLPSLIAQSDFWSAVFLMVGLIALFALASVIGQIQRNGQMLDHLDPDILIEAGLYLAIEIALWLWLVLDQEQESKISVGTVFSTVAALGLGFVMLLPADYIDTWYLVVFKISFIGFCYWLVKELFRQVEVNPERRWDYCLVAGLGIGLVTIFILLGRLYGVHYPKDLNGLIIVVLFLAPFILLCYFPIMKNRHNDHSN